MTMPANNRENDRCARCGHARRLHHVWVGLTKTDALGRCRYNPPHASERACDCPLFVQVPSL